MIRKTQLRQRRDRYAYLDGVEDQSRFFDLLTSDILERLFGVMPEELLQELLETTDRSQWRPEHWAYISQVLQDMMLDPLAGARSPSSWGCLSRMDEDLLIYVHLSMLESRIDADFFEDGITDKKLVEQIRYLLSLSPDKRELTDERVRMGGARSDRPVRQALLKLKTKALPPFDNYSDHLVYCVNTACKLADERRAKSPISEEEMFRRLGQEAAEGIRMFFGSRTCI